MEITELSFPCSVEIVAYGFRIKLLSIVSKNGILFTGDVKKDNLKLNVKELPKEERTVLEDELSKQLDNTEKNVKEQKSKTDEKSKVMAVLNRISLENIGLFFDFKLKRTVFYLEVKVDLKETVSFFDGAFELDYLKLDLIVSSGNKPISEDDRDRKETIKKHRKTIWNEQAKENTLKELVKKVNNNSNVFQELQNKLSNQKSLSFSNATNLIDTQIKRTTLDARAYERKMNQLQQVFSNQKADVFDAHHGLEKLTRQQNKETKLLKTVAEQFKEKDLDFVKKEEEIQKISAKTNQLNQLKPFNFDKKDDLPWYNFVSDEQTIENLKADKQGKFENLKELNQSDILWS